MVRGYRFNEYIIYLSTIRVFIFGSFLIFSPRFQREALSWFDRVTSNSFYISHDYNAFGAMEIRQAPLGSTLPIAHFPLPPFFEP